MEKLRNDFIDDDMVVWLYAAIESLSSKCKMASSLAKSNRPKQ